MAPLDRVARRWPAISDYRLGVCNIDRGGRRRRAAYGAAGFAAAGAYLLANVASAVSDPLLAGVFVALATLTTAVVLAAALRRAGSDTPNSPPPRRRRMVSGPALLVAAVLVGVNTLAAALMTRLFRVRLDTAWGAGVFVAMFCPVATTLVTILVGSVAPPVGSRTDLVVWFILVPVALGATVDVFWMPAPEEVDLPANLED